MEISIPHGDLLSSKTRSGSAIFGDGRINSYDPATGAFLGTLMKADGTPLTIDGLWALLPLGDGVYFTAGVADEAHGLFGLITQD